MLPYNREDLDFLLSHHGKPVTISYKTFTAYDPATGLVTSTGSDIQSTGFIYSFDKEEIDGTSVLMSDRKCLLSGSLSQSPEPNDTINGLTIISVSQIESGGDVMCYMCQLRS